MKVLRTSFDALQPLSGRWVVTLGTFDGVHRGHAAIVAECRTQAEAHGLSGACAVSFLHHPRSILPQQRAPRILTTVAERIALLQLTGLDQLILLEFDAQLASVEYDRFVRDVLLARLGMSHLVLGHDVHFGKNRGGNLQSVAELAEADGFTLSQVASIREGGAPISSTRIRDLVGQGEVQAAAQLLGHPHVAVGTVVEGRKLGRELGFPTANLEELGEGKLLPAPGVYAGWVQVGPEGSWTAAVINIGTAPTVSPQGPLRLETHLLGFEGELYGRRLGVAFRRRLRAERRMSGLDELKEAIRADVSETETLADQPPRKLQLVVDQEFGEVDPA